MGLTVNLTLEEKQKITTFILNLKTSYESKAEAYTKELPLLEKCLQETPKDASATWITALKNKITEWKTNASRFSTEIANYEAVIIKLNSKKEENFIKYSNIFTPLYISEKSKKLTDTKYKYYPRLKKAKEQSLYVFANKLKTIMESENVKIA